MARSTFVALLRGINVGGRTLIRMADLRDLFESLGFDIQSGNVVFESSGADATKVAGRIEDAIEREHGLRPSVIVRTPVELAKIAKANPFLAAGAPESKLHVSGVRTRSTAVAAPVCWSHIRDLLTLVDRRHVGGARR